MNSNLNYRLNPNWVTGFVVGKGCFYIGISKSRSHIVRWNVKACFVIKLYARDQDVLSQIKSFFNNVGYINTNDVFTTYKVQ